MKIMNPDIIEFLHQSNLIEGVNTSTNDAVKAWEYIASLDKIKVSDILEVHRLLMENLNSRIAGSFRKVNVRVGNYLCPNPGMVNRLLHQWIEEVNLPISDAKAVHVGFEKIHPFEDGNGRVGRILYNWHRIKAGLPIHIIHEGKEQMEYYKWFS